MSYIGFHAFLILQPLSMLIRVSRCGPFAGSSITGIAAAESACYFVGYETNRKFIRLSNERLSRLEK